MSALPALLSAIVRPCPWCNGAKVWVWDKAIPGMFSIACSDPRCGATGPIRPTIEEAVIAWNAAQRRKPSRLEQAVVDELNDPEGVRDVSGR